ncbi:phosphatidylinositol-4-phosphate 5-Kinase [Colletotrichum graminicola M1.001]|uniref:1-phosphatidylinositol-3-phosphate 5-kinase n=1 Tax=Colletotrichum graminicola (strain M1.001 / M2 / FGSC 10212) TaxID=645133 RepID=E3Q4B8_COLGM|nr:phosphatidylinositol-4-phosphate 5-Kinase [Colletotrichum graminicola M1.001]EFQ25430.1 phosphatidylinositol-4-phosphate 5-Kinase [Colletotrichum graminicola M1.001]
MASNNTSKPNSPAVLSTPPSFRSRHDSINSISTASQVDKDQLAHTLNRIHTSASQSDCLTTFNDFAPPPTSLPATETKVLTGELVQNGLSGLYSRLKEAVGAVGTRQQDVDDGDSFDAASKRSNSTAATTPKIPIASLARAETATTSSSFNSGATHDGPMAATSSSGINTVTSDSQSHPPQSSKATSISAMTASKSSTSSRQSLPSVAKASAVTAINPEVAPATAPRNVARIEDGPVRSSGRRSISKQPDPRPLVIGSESSHKFDVLEPKHGGGADQGHTSIRTRREDVAVDGPSDKPLSPIKTNIPQLPSLQTADPRSPASSTASMMLVPKRPAVIDRISRSRSPGFAPSRSSSMEHVTAEPSPISTTAHDSVYHDSFAHDSQPKHGRTGALRIPGTTTNEGAPDQVNARLDRMRRQVLSKEFWMADETCKECFICGQPFSAFRRKHHCRTCGCIFDSKCTSIIPASKFGMTGTLRVCKTCLKVINQRLYEGSASDDSGDDSFLPAIFRQTKATPKVTQVEAEPEEPSFADRMEDLGDSRSVQTPMMAIPATRRINDSNRNSAILEIDAPQLSRPSSSRSLKSLTSANRPQSSGHRRHHSKHHNNYMSRFKPMPDDRAPFRKGITEEMAKKPKYPAFHDDNIIDPELAAYMSDESSDDEQMSIFATMSNADLQPSSYDHEKSSFGPFLSTGRRHRLGRGEKSISGLSFTSRGIDDNAGSGSLIGHGRPGRRRNLSNVSHQMRSPRPKSGIFKGPSASNENMFATDNPVIEATKLTRSDSMQADKQPQVELNSSSMLHVKRLLHQLLEDSGIPNVPAWEKALIPILLQCTDDVTPDIRAGDDMDIRHYVKLKKIPGGKPGDTSYVSGVIFTKNLALKSMPRRILSPRIVIVSFPIEYQRHQQHFMSLQPVIEQEKEFLRIVVNRIINLRPQILLCEKSVSGVALQYLSEANIAVAYNVKPSVIEAVSRCAETDIISSLDMLALQVQVGRSGGFEVKTYVNKNYPGKKKTYIFLSGCSEKLGCTIALRGDSTEVLSKMKKITEFMVYVVYNLKLETCLMRDEYIQLPAEPEESSLLGSSVRQNPEDAPRSLTASTEIGKNEPQVTKTSPTDTELPSQTSDGTSLVTAESTLSSDQTEEPATEERPPLVSLHATHVHVPPTSPDSQVPEDVPMPTYYSDMVARYETKILSASPFVKFAQPYLLMKAREQERRLVYLKRLRDQDVVEEQIDPEKSKSQKFQLIKPEMVHAIGQKAPRQVMEILHAVHDAEYDKALYNYQTQTRQWENYIQGNLDLFDPYSHQNIVVLYSVICTETKIPCSEPGLIAIAFYDEHVDESGSMDPDCTLGQYIEDLCISKDSICTSNGCDRKMTEHHRTYVHDESRVTIFVEPAAKRRNLDGITMWSYCKTCKKDSPEMGMSDSTWKYSFGKYLELLFWSRGLRLHEITGCPHDHHRDHIRYFHYRDTWVRIHYDPIDLLEIIVPRARITWKVENDLKLKNEIFNKIEERWARFINSVKLRLKSIRIDSVLPEKADACKAEVDRLAKKAQDDQVALIRRLQETYVNSKYYEVIPFNAIVREMLEKAGDWDTSFTKFETDFLPDKDLRQLTMIQLKKIFTDNESRESLPSTDGNSTVESGEPPSQTFSDVDEKVSTQPTDPTEPHQDGVVGSVEDEQEKQEELEQEGSKEEEEAEEPSTLSEPQKEPEQAETTKDGVVGREAPEEADKIDAPADTALERVESLDLATPGSPKAKGLVSFAPINEAGQISAMPGNAESTYPLVARPPLTTTSTNISLSEKVEQLRREQQVMGAETSQTGDASEAPKTNQERGLARRAPMVRTLSQPAQTLPRSQSSFAKSIVPKDAMGAETLGETSFKVDKKTFDRLALGMKSHRKAGPSSIPRLITKKKDTHVASQVSRIARHFEQLSREFEKERQREDRRKRLAKGHQPRAGLPRSATKAIVEVYHNIDNAVQEAGPSNTEHNEIKILEPKPAPVNPAPPGTVQTEPDSPPRGESDLAPEAAPPTEEHQVGGETDDTATVTASHGGSDDEGQSDTEQSILDDLLPDVKELADSLEPSTEIPLELPKHQKTSLMKMLTNFWAERSASGWPQLDYPVNASDHIFLDSDVIVREDEPSSVIAFALSSDDYRTKLADIRRQERMAIHNDYEANFDAKSSGLSDTGGELMMEEGELEKSLLRATGTHLKYQFKEGSATMLCKIFYAEQFDALRRKCGVADRIVESLSRCLKWDSKGGKTKSVFLKTLDDRLVLKGLSPIETSAFLRFAPAYFGIMAEALFHDLPSVIAKMLGFFQLIIKNPVTGVEIKLDLLLMENLFYDRSPTRLFDLKGSMRNRKIQSTGEQNEVLLDENMVEFIYESPLFAREHSKKLLRASVWNDTLFLARQNVMDYSLMIAVDEARKELVVGIIDCIRTYTWDKKLESWIKDRGFAGGGRNRPTVTSPKEYKSRFREAMARYILQAPNCWHQFGVPQITNSMRPRFDFDTKPE